MANNLSIKHDLLKLKGATIMPIKGKSGDVECLVIPIELANLYKGATGCYMDSTAIPLTNPKAGSKDTHLIKQSFSKDKFSAMSDADKQSIPIMGNLIDWEKSNSVGNNNAPAAQSAPPSWL